MDIIGKVKSESVEKHTNKGWAEWLKILDKAGAKNWVNKEITAHLAKKHKLSPWWSQIVATGYLIAIGKKIDGVNDRGERSLTATRTMNLSRKKMWEYLESPEGQALWLKPLSDFEFKPKCTFETLDGYFGEVRTVKAPTRARLTWQEPEWDKPTVVQIYVNPRPGEKCLLIFMHEKIRDGRTQEMLRAHWKNALEAIANALPETSKSVAKAKKKTKKTRSR